MKKIIFSLSVVMFTFSLAVAQQNQLFDLQKHLQEKSKKDQKQKLLEQNPFLRKMSNSIVVMPNPPQAKLSHTLDDGSKIYLLPLDNMPCVEPDMKKYNEMPNLSSQTKHKLLPDDLIMPKQLSRIPNLSGPRRWNIIPYDSNK